MADIFGIGQIIGSGITAGANIAGSIYGNEMAAHREQDARQENYRLNEQAAENADARTRALYNDLYSPAAQLQQLKAAGLSPSLFYGDGGGISGQTGAQGSGAAGISPNVFGMPNFDFSQLAKSIAETKLLNAEADKVKSETTGQDLANDVKEIENKVFKVTTELMTSFVDLRDADGNSIGTRSMYEVAEDAISYDEFLNTIEKNFKSSGNDSMVNTINTELGNKIMRDIYYAANKMNRDIKVLTAEGTDADFQKSIVTALRQLDYEGKNAQAIVAQLNQQIEASELDARQKEAWNNIMERLKRRNSEASDWIIVLGLIVDRFMTSYMNLNVSNNRSNNNNTSTSTVTLKK